jgi:hypothetical protein
MRDWALYGFLIVAVAALVPACDDGDSGSDGDAGVGAGGSGSSGSGGNSGGGVGLGGGGAGLGGNGAGTGGNDGSGGNGAGTGGNGSGNGGNGSGNGGMMGGGGGMMGGGDTVAECSSLVQCLNGCGADQGCATACQDEASDAANAAFSDIINCAQFSACINMADGTIDQACLDMNCSAELGACFGESVDPGGNGTCGELNGCLNTCGPNDANCQNGCVEATSPEGFQQFQDAIACIQMAGCQPGDVACQQENCGAELEACLGSPVEPMGDGTCNELDECLTGCGQNDQACLDGCIEGSSQEGFDALGAVVQCIQANMCADDACVETNCADELAACDAQGGGMMGGGGGAGGEMGAGGAGGEMGAGGAGGEMGGGGAGGN